jgi:magnesium-transporting ATPase (P-type)
MLSAVFASQGTVVVAGRARSVVIGVGSSTAMGSIRDAMLRTEDVSNWRFAPLMHIL